MLSLISRPLFKQIPFIVEAVILSSMFSLGVVLTHSTSMDSTKKTRRIHAVVVLPLVLLRRILSSNLPDFRLFTIDYFGQLLLLFQISYTSNQYGQRIISRDNIPRLFWFWYFAQWILVFLTWAYGYIGLSPETPKKHVYAATVRLVLSSASIGYLVLAQIYITEYWLVSFYVGCVWLLSVIHFCGAIQRLRWHQNLQRKLNLNPENNFINLMTGSKMSYLSNEERDLLKRTADDAVKDGVAKQEFWYHPHLPIETNRRNFWQRLLKRFSSSQYYHSVKESDMMNDVLDSHFSACHCCLPSDSARELAPSLDYIENNQRQMQRLRFLNWPPSRHRVVVVPPTDASTETSQGEDYQPHVLCDKCRLLCGSSLLIEIARGWSFETYWKYLSRAFMWEPLVEECFEHWPTPAALQEKARMGCHLCTLMWQTLSQEQQDELLAHDSELASSLERKLLNASGLEEMESLRTLFHSRRCIQVKPQSPWAQKRWRKSWELSHDANALRLIPHFGQGRVARRWMNRRSADRAVSVGQDPTLSWHLETVEAIEIISTYPTDRGPIFLPLSRSTSSQTTMKFIKSWLHDHEHSKYSDETHNSDSDSDVDHPLPGSISLERMNQTSRLAKSVLEFLPSRLVDVGSPERPQIRIKLRKEIEHEHKTAGNRAITPDYRYVALSHCWGKPKFATLMKANVSEFRKSIPANILARTFQDAIFTTRALGLRFVWIDSLCIIQDSNEDWQREAMTMKDVYTNAYFILAAAKAWDSSESFFTEQNPLAMNPCLLAIRDPKVSSASKRNERLHFGCIYAYPLPRYRTDVRDTVQLCRLKSRAWCYQELALAKRIVYFAEYQVILECKETCKRVVRQVQWEPLRRVNSFPSMVFIQIASPILNMLGKLIANNYRRSPLPRFLTSWRRTQFLSNSTAKSTHCQQSSSLIATYETPPHVLLKSQWWTEVGKYSCCFMSFESDKLQALAGIAASYQSQVIAQELDCQYLAGLWQSPFLVTGLLWYVAQRQDSRPTHYRAPSWSWASVEGTIMNNSLQGGDAFECSGVDVLEATVVGPDTENVGNEQRYPLGTCTDGLLLLRGVLKKANVRKLLEGHKKYYVGHGSSKRQVRDERDLRRYVSISTDPVSGPSVCELTSEDESDIVVGHFIPDIEDEIPSALYCLQIIVKPDCRSGEEDFSVPYVTRGLALVPTEPETENFAEEGLYRRVGYIEIEHTLGGVTTHNTFSLPWSSETVNANAIRSPAPNIDVGGFFRYTAPREVRIV